ncbi:hypothetical protein CXB74_011665 [Morganella morganii]|nr:hypothetical protein [Morganella morganii]QXO44672.1 hypothetical protein CXB74_011665 [Morganella morganii]
MLTTGVRQSKRNECSPAGIRIDRAAFIFSADIKAIAVRDSYCTEAL